MFGSLRMKLDTLMYHDESSVKQELQVFKQRQKASGNKDVFVSLNYLCLVL